MLGAEGFLWMMSLGTTASGDLAQFGLEALWARTLQGHSISLYSAYMGSIGKGHTAQIEALGVDVLRV